jgi:hypothetical protein
MRKSGCQSIAMEEPMRKNPAAQGRVWCLGMFAAALLLAGCGDFWQNPGGTTSGSGGDTATTTTLTPSTTTPAVGDSVTLTATVSPAAATGTVTFLNNSASIGSGTLSGGTATTSVTFTSAGTESLTASYGGDTTYASSTSEAQTVTVSAATMSAEKPNALVAAAGGALLVKTTSYQQAALHATGNFASSGGNYGARNAEAAVVEGGGSVTLSDATLSSAAGDGRGILLTRSGTTPAATGAARFTMTGGSIAYSCPGSGSAGACGGTAGVRSQPATVFAVTGTTAAITLSDVKVTNDTASEASEASAEGTPAEGTLAEGTLLTASASGPRGHVAGSHAIFLAKGTVLTGDVVADRASSAELSLLADAAGTGSSLTGALGAGQSAGEIDLTLDAASAWTVTATSYLNNLSGLQIDASSPGSTVENIDGGGHCVYYAGTLDGSSEGLSGRVFALSGGGFLAPAGTTGLACN